MNVKDIGEDRLIERLVSGLAQRGEVIVGPGDDCAVLEGGVLLKTDCVVEGVHFLASEDARRVGWKAVARVVSDFVSMGGRPQALLVTLAISEQHRVDWLEALYAGMQSCAERYDCSIVGGETSSLPAGAVISVAGTGYLASEQPLLRSTAAAGDAVFVTGRLGGSLAGWHLDFQPRLENMLWLLEHYRPSAMMDLSDGLAKDLARLAKASGLDYELDLSKLPCMEGASLEQALGDGEDYELLLTLPEEQAGRLIRDKGWLSLPAPFTKIGVMCEKGEGGGREQGRGNLAGGWEHFS